MNVFAPDPMTVVPVAVRVEEIWAGEETSNPLSQPVPIFKAVSEAEPFVIFPILIPLTVPAVDVPVVTMLRPFWVISALVLVWVVIFVPLQVHAPVAQPVNVGGAILMPFTSLVPAPDVFTVEAIFRPDVTLFPDVLVEESVKTRLVRLPVSAMV